MPDIAQEPAGIRTPAQRRLVRWAGASVLAAAVIFIGYRLAALRPEELLVHATWPMAGALAGASLVFAGANALFAQGWRTLADPGEVLAPRQAQAIYGRGVLTKYLPGSVFQYVSRQLGGRAAGLGHAILARASLEEVVIHVAASLSVAAFCLLAGERPWLSAAAGTALVAVLLSTGMRRLRAVALQLLAFGGFALAAILVAAALLPGEGVPAAFGGLFLIAWLAGFLVPVAPGGLGVREAAMLGLAGTLVPAPVALAAVLALRIASILGDLAFGLATLVRSR